MRIAIDVDDCISNTMEVDFACAWEYNKKLNPNDDKLYFANHNNPPTIFGFSKEVDDEFYIEERKRTVDENLIHPKVFAAKAINKLLSEGHEVFIVTARSDFSWGDALALTEKWLKKADIKYTKCVANVENKGVYCKENNIDIMIEDNTKFAKQINDLSIKTILLLAEYNKKYEHELNVFASCWPEIYDKIQCMKKNKIKKGV